MVETPERLELLRRIRERRRREQEAMREQRIRPRVDPSGPPPI